MDEALSSVVEDNTEEILKQHFGVDEASAIVDKETENPKKFMMEVKYEGEVENEDQFFSAEIENEDYWQYVKIITVVDETTLLASYTMVRRDQLDQVKDEFVVKES